MEMDIDRFYQLIDNTKPVYGTEIQKLRRLVNEYPYFQHAIFLYLQTLHKINDNYFNNELQRLSIYVKDRKVLFYFIFKDEFGTFFEKTGKTEIAPDRTSMLLNAFFDNSSIENSNLEYETFNASIATLDYFHYLNVEPEIKKGEEQKAVKAKQEAPKLKHQTIIDSFIERSQESRALIQIDKESLKESKETYEIEEEDSEEALSDDIFFTETLAKIYIKQKRYDKAHKIIKHLSLNYPKKNTYFADQLSFLEKLIINSKYKDKK